MSAQEGARARKRAMEVDFFRKGLLIAILSGICYGLFTALLNLGLDTGVWALWAGGAVSAFALTYVVSALGSALMYSFSAIFSLLLAASSGKLGDFFRTIPTKPGLIILAAAILGGPLAGTAYVIALQEAGSIVIPISALSTAIGSILGRFFFKQELSAHMVLGIFICFAASLMIAGQSLFGEPSEDMLLGLAMAFLSALGWGLEGCIAGFATCMVDAQIGISIRQLAGGLTNLCLLVPLLSAGSGLGATYGWQLLSQALCDLPSLTIFAASGLFAMFAYSLWYKGNSMVGAALGMAASGAYSFWGPFFSWIILGLIGGKAGWSIPALGWIAALVMILGIIIIAMNPLDLWRRHRN